MQYNLWFLLLGLLAVPFIPIPLISFPQIFSWFCSIRSSPVFHAESIANEVINTNLTQTTDRIHDFTLSVKSETPSVISYILLGIWFVGILAMMIMIIKSSLRLRTLKKSALPLQNLEVRRLYQQCLDEMYITRDIPIYSTAFLKSPIIVGFLKPCIYLPIHLISDYQESDIRYILLHELQHYKHKDAIVSFLMNLYRVLYWFNPFVWYALREIRNDREVACDTSVLKILDEIDYEDYGNTLINFVEKFSSSPFPFAASLSGNMKQMKRRIINIVSYKKPTLYKKLKGMTAFIVITVLIVGLAPFISTYEADESHYQWKSSSENISYVDFSAYFGEYDGSFVLYNLENDVWSIHNKNRATLRVSPDSTYKIYDALFGLEEGFITPEDSLIAWNGKIYPFEAWNADQTLQTAMTSSVNWYFQSIDEQLKVSDLYNYIQQIGYGNKNVSGNSSTYWMESYLKISPVEQVKLLIKLHNNTLGFSYENMNAVKDSICLFYSDERKFYAKTGTGRVDGQDVNGWFIGFVETSDNTYFFATNIGSNRGANGSNASKITMSILSDMNIWKPEETHSASFLSFAAFFLTNLFSFYCSF